MEVGCEIAFSGGRKECMCRQLNKGIFFFSGGIQRASAGPLANADRLRVASLMRPAAACEALVLVDWVCVLGVEGDCLRVLEGRQTAARHRDDSVEMCRHMVCLHLIKWELRAKFGQFESLNWARFNQVCLSKLTTSLHQRLPRLLGDVYTPWWELGGKVIQIPAVSINLYKQIFQMWIRKNIYENPPVVFGRLNVSSCRRK